MSQRHSDIQPPSVAASAKDSGVYNAFSVQCRGFPVNFCFYLLMIRGIVIQSPIFYGADKHFFGLPHTRHVDQHEAVIEDFGKKPAVLPYHAVIHLPVTVFYLFLLTHCFALLVGIIIKNMVSNTLIIIAGG